MTDSSDKIPGNAPEQVRQVAQAWIGSAVEMAEEIIEEEEYGMESAEEQESTMRFWSTRIWVEEKASGVWVIQDSYEGCNSLLVYKEELDQWFYQKLFGQDGPDRPMEGGFIEALGNAEIMWTG